MNLRPDAAALRQLESKGIRYQGKPLTKGAVGHLPAGLRAG